MSKKEESENIGRKKPGKTDTSAKKKAKREKSKLNFVLLITAILAGIVAVGVVIWGIISVFSMKEISTHDDLPQELLENYFYGDHGCFDAEITFFRKENLDISKLDSLTKERLVIGYMAYYGFSGMTYDEINSAYKNYYGNDEDIRRKDTYVSQEGTYTLKEDGIYELESNCDTPEFAVCTIIDHAYEKGNTVKLQLRVFTIDWSNGNIYSGIDTSVDPLGDQEVTADIDNIDLPKWEVTFKKDKDLDLFIIDSTRKM